MSLIQAIITNKYAMLCSDTKAYTLSGTHVDDCHKIIPIGDGIMFDHTINDKADFITIRKVRNADGTIRLKCSN